MWHGRKNRLLRSLPCPIVHVINLESLNRRGDNCTKKDQIEGGKDVINKHKDCDKKVSQP